MHRMARHPDEIRLRQIIGFGAPQQFQKIAHSQ
jgi:hypothetical protein